MKGFKKLIPLILMILTMILVPLGTRADFGDYSGDSDGVTAVGTMIPTTIPITRAVRAAGSRA